jgi:hypothetical protein
MYYRHIVYFKITLFIKNIVKQNWKLFFNLNLIILKYINIYIYNSLARYECKMGHSGLLILEYQNIK